jgi:hypothetical protein
VSTAHPLDWRFRERAGLIEADLGSEWPGFNDALNDCVTSRAPRGYPEGLSTYWIDRTLDALAHAEPGAVIASGNATTLIALDNAVCARSNYEVHDDEHMPTELFSGGLRAWRAAVVGPLEARSGERRAE